MLHSVACHGETVFNKRLSRFAPPKRASRVLQHNGEREVSAFRDVCAC